MDDCSTPTETAPDVGGQVPMGAADSLIDVIRTRRSVRRFTPERIPEEALQKIFEAARWAPTNCNKQLWRMVVIDEQRVKERLVREAGASTLIINAPIVMVVAHYNDVLLEAYQAASAAVQNVLLMANALGLGSLWLNSKGNPDRCRDVLGIPKEYIITNLILLGYPVAPALPPPRRKVSELFCRNQFPQGRRHQWVHDPECWSYDQIAEYQRFICRKTEAGTCQDVFAEAEGELVGKMAQDFGEPHVDFFSYDGHIARYLPKGLALTAVDSGTEPSSYTRETLRGRASTQFQTWEQFVASPGGQYSSASLLFRAERLPSAFIQELSAQAMAKLVPGGTFFLVFRNRNLFFRLFHGVLVSTLGDNLSKTAVYSFFGPYKPCDTGAIKRTLSSAGFSVRVSTRYPIPPVFARIAELMTQYRLSKGGNFMHTLRNRSLLSRLFDLVNRVQARYRLPWLGSLSVLVATKPKDEKNRAGLSNPS